jgi:hypothetical protein
MNILSSLNLSNSHKRLSREKLLLILDAANRTASFRFLRQAALAWLTNYPGDLGVNPWLAKGFVAEGKPQQAQQILEKLCRLDPEFVEAQEVLNKINQDAGSEQAFDSLANMQMSDFAVSANQGAANLPRILRRVRLLLQKGETEQAEKTVQQVLDGDTGSVYAAIMQLHLASANGDNQVLLELSLPYRTRWPECLQIALFQAAAQLENGDEGSAVQLLHKCVVNDAAAQVPQRIWGENYEYSPLWPDPMEISFDLAIPAAVSGLLGWNLLPAANPQPEAIENVQAACEEETQLDAVSMSDAVTDGFVIPDVKIGDGAAGNEEVFPFLEQLIATEEAQGPTITEDGVETELSPQDFIEPDMPDGFNRAEIPGETIEVEPEEEAPSPVVGPEMPPAAAVPALNTPDLQPVKVESLRSVQDEFERMAKKLKMPGLGRADGRFPVYVIFSTVEGLRNQYGYGTLAVLDKEMQRLAGCVRKRQGWDAMVYYPDSDACADKMGLNVVESATDPWKLKLALKDLDTALAKKGEMIGAVLIVGGHEAVPFHYLPNPTDDMDSEIASDNPYATLDSNYFIQDWPVGRLPGEIGPDAGMLLEGLRRLIRYHSQYLAANGKHQPKDFWQRVQVFLQGRAKRKYNGSFGYTAAAWKRPSLAVYRTIGEAASLMASPPQSTGSIPAKKAVSMAYYNLHGLVDAAEWYGQRDMADQTPGPDYPIALSPKDLGGKGRSPEIIFSEACYGGHIIGKTEEQSMALKFIAQGSLVLVGSTCASYGSVGTPLIGADLLGNYFWKNVKLGTTVGEAMLQARVDLVREMNKRQGFLDAEDQKTLISFILYGDPLVSTGWGNSKQSKSFLRSRSHPVIKTMTDQKDDSAPAQPVPAEVVKQVKGLVSEYLPGLDHADMHICKQISSNGKKPGEPVKPFSENDRTVVTVGTHIQVGQKIHHQVARLTLDGKGKMVKLALSR